jgi:tetratricopeptide (TPR) repeat protein
MKKNMLILMYLIGILARNYAQDNYRTLGELNLAIRREPENAALYRERGQVYVMMHDYFNALEDYLKAVEFEPTIDNYNRLGAMYLYLGMFKEAPDAFTKIIEIDPRSPHGLSNRGACYVILGEFHDAIDDLNKGLLIDPDDAASYYWRGTAYDGLEQYQEAVEDFNHAIAIQPDYAAAYYSRGVAYYSQDKFQEALNDLNKAIFLPAAGGNANDYNARAKIYLKLAEQAEDSALRQEYQKKAEEDFATAEKLRGTR